MRVENNIRIGRAHIKPTRPTHVRGVREGNDSDRVDQEKGVYRDGEVLKGRPSRSTGVAAKDRRPIDIRMPTLTPP